MEYKGTSWNLMGYRGIAARKLHAFAGRRATDIWDCGPLQKNMYGICLEPLGICMG